MKDILEIELELDHILAKEQIDFVFQGIYSAHPANIIGFEALVRGPNGSKLASPMKLFDAARRFEKQSELEAMCRHHAIRKFANLNLPGRLFLNVSQHALENDFDDKYQFNALLKQNGMKGSDLVIEITEEHPSERISKINEVMESLRGLGIQFAIDDLGMGYSGLTQWASFQPEIVKIDKFFVRDCHKDPLKREFLRSLIHLGSNTHAQLIAEGIETQDELKVVLELGIDFVQGFLMQKPNMAPSRSLPAALQSLPEHSDAHFEFGGETVMALLERNKAVEWDTPTKQVMGLFRDNKTLPAVVVLSQGQPVGLALRAELMEHFSLPFGHALHDNKPISYLMIRDMVMVEADTSLDDLSRKLTDSSQLEARAPFVITKNGQYAGIGSVRNLLKKVTEAKIQHAKYANPLTLLPGNVPIDKEIDFLLAHKRPFFLAYLDLNHFKPFNDVYGYSKGDMAIQLVARLSQQYGERTGAFIGHIGGDDFVLIFSNDKWRAAIADILSEFDREMCQFFDQEHIDKGGYWAQSRSGQNSFFPLLSLSAGVIEPDPHLCRSHHDVAELASEAKKEAKKESGSAMFLCRRRAPITKKRDLLTPENGQPLNLSPAIKLT